MIFDLVQDFAAVLDTMPDGHPRRRILSLLDEAVRRDVHFIDRHSPTLFQCLWNTCWWYDCREAAQHYDLSKRLSSEPLPWDRPGLKLYAILEGWRRAKEMAMPDFPWLRSLRPAPVHLCNAQQAILRHEDPEELRGAQP